MLNAHLHCVIKRSSFNSNAKCKNSVKLDNQPLVMTLVVDGNGFSVKLIDIVVEGNENFLLLVEVPLLPKD